MTDLSEFLLGSAATLAVAGLVQYFRGQRKSAVRFAIGTALVLGTALMLELYLRMRR